MPNGCFERNMQKMSKTERKNINIEFYILETVKVFKF